MSSWKIASSFAGVVAVPFGESVFKVPVKYFAMPDCILESFTSAVSFGTFLVVLLVIMVGVFLSGSRAEGA